MSDRPWAVGEEVVAHLLRLASLLDKEAELAALPRSTTNLETAAAQLRVLATHDPLVPQHPNHPRSE